MEIPLKLCIPFSLQDVAVLEGAYRKSKITIKLSRKKQVLIIGGIKGLVFLETK